GPGDVTIPIGIGHRPYLASAAELSRSHWSTLPQSPLGRRSNPILAWTGKDLLEVGGTRNGVFQRTGAAFSSITRRSHAIPTSHRNVGLSGGALSVWTGHRLFVASSKPARVLRGTCCRGAPAGLYDPATNRWTTTESLPGQLVGLELTTPVWTGHD